MCHCQFVVFVTDPGSRLVRGSGPHEGLLEIYHNGTWGTVCDDKWDLQDARGLCHQLGYINATTAAGPARFSSGSGPILFSELSCVGNESTITECDHLSSGHNCNHSQVVGAVCEGQSILMVLVVCLTHNVCVAMCWILPYS